MNLMRPVWLDYLRPNPEQGWPGLAFLISSIVLAGALLLSSNLIQSKLTVIELDVAKLKKQAERQRLFTSVSNTENAAEKLTSRAVSPSSAHWEALFAALEAASDDTVTLLGLTPGASEIMVSGEARDLAAALDYVQRLQAAAVLVNPHLVKYETIREHARLPVRFTLLAAWRAAPQ